MFLLSFCNVVTELTIITKTLPFTCWVHRRSEAYLNFIYVFVDLTGSPFEVSARYKCFRETKCNMSVYQILMSWKPAKI